MVQGRHEVQVGDLVAADEIEGGGGLEPRLADKSAREERHREQGAYAHGVVERHHPEGAFAVAVAVLRDVRDGGGALGAVGSGDTLRTSGGAGGVEHDRDVVRACPRDRIRGCAATEVVERDGAAAGPAHRDPGDRTGMRRVRDRIGRHRLEAHRPRAGIAEHVVELLGLRAPVHRRDHHPRDLAGPVQGRGLDAVLENGDQVVAVAQPHCIEPGHRTQRELDPVAVGEGSVAVDDSDGGRLAFGDVEEGAAEVEHRGVSEVASESGVAFRTGARRGRSVSGNADRDSARSTIAVVSVV